MVEYFYQMGSKDKIQKMEFGYQLNINDFQMNINIVFKIFDQLLDWIHNLSINFKKFDE